VIRLFKKKPEPITTTILPHSTKFNGYQIHKIINETLKPWYKKYCIEKPLAAYRTNLIIETENAVKLLDAKLQIAYRILTNKGI
jgi:hypothetical protein